MSDDQGPRWQPLLTGLALARNVLDRADRVRKDDDEIERLWRLRSTRVLVLNGHHAPVSNDPTGEDGKRLILQSSYELDSADIAERFFLGFTPEGEAIFAVDAADRGWVPHGATLRDVGAELPGLDAEIFTTVVGLANWHRGHSHCPICGGPTVADRAGWVRRCPADTSEHFPRTDPAVIVLVRDPQDRALLGRRSIWPEGWFSTLAGFVEPGESAEAAVAREVREESAIVVDAATVQFLGSQPWPFPASIMLGFHAYTDDDAAPVGDGEEIAEARWFERDELARLCGSGEIKIPPAVSIARHLVERWYGSTLPGSWSRP